MSLPLLFMAVCVLAFALAGLLSTTLLIAGSQILSRGLEALLELRPLRR
jgi:hypothetical protein